MTFLLRALRLSLLSLLLAACTSGLAQPGTGVMRLVFLDVGQGDSLLITTPDGRSALIDAGPDPSVAARLVREEGVTSLDVVVASHADADHIGGMAEVARQFRPGFFLNNGIPHTTATYQRTIAAFQEVGSQGMVAGERTISLGESVKLQVLAPNPAAGSVQHANSVGILLSFAGFRAFLAGDAEAETTSYWQARYGKALADVDIHKALHHGSRHNDTGAFLALLKPENVVVSVGVGNTYGHPTNEALALYQGVGARVYRTDLYGTVSFTVRQDGTYTVTTAKAAEGGQAGSYSTTDPSSGTRVTATFPVAPLPYDPRGPDRDCKDFRSQAEAQAFFTAAGGPTRDPHRLDNDKDGIACEDLR